KKEMIVTPEGLNVFPEDVEGVLNHLPGVRDSAVVGLPMTGGSEERVHAVLVLEPGVNPADVRRTANAGAGDAQKIRTALVARGGGGGGASETRSQEKGAGARPRRRGKDRRGPPAGGGGWG